MKKYLIISFVFTCLFYVVACKDHNQSTDVYVKEPVEIVSGNYTSKYTIKTANSSILWYCGYKVGATEHYGTILCKDGFLALDGDNIIEGTLTIDMKSISVKDISDNIENNKLVNHLKSTDFFKVDSFETATLIIKNVENELSTNEVSLKDHTCNATGILIIKGIRQVINFPLKYHFENDQIYLNSEFKINRLLWDINYASSLSHLNILADKIIDDEITIKVTIIASK